MLVVWKLDRLGRNLAHLVNTLQDLSARGVGLRVLAGQGAQIDTTTAAGRLVFGIFAALAEFERGTDPGRTRAGLAAARARGRKGGRSSRCRRSRLRNSGACGLARSRMLLVNTPFGPDRRLGEPAARGEVEVGCPDVFSTARWDTGG